MSESFPISTSPPPIDNFITTTTPPLDQSSPAAAEDSASHVPASLSTKNRRYRKRPERTEPTSGSSTSQESKTSKRPRKKIAPEVMQEAVNEHLKDGTSLMHLSRKYGIPPSTLSDKIRKKHPKGIGRPFSLPVELEKNLAQFVPKIVDGKQHVQLEFMGKILAIYASTQGSSNCTFKATNSWWKGFLKRWNLQEVEERQRKLSSTFQRFPNYSEDTIEAFVRKLFEVFNAYLNNLSNVLDQAITAITVQDLLGGLFSISQTPLASHLRTFPASQNISASTSSSTTLPSEAQSSDAPASLDPNSDPLFFELVPADGRSLPQYFLSTNDIPPADRLDSLKRDFPDFNLEVFSAPPLGNALDEALTKMIQKVEALRHNLPSIIVHEPFFSRTDCAFPTPIPAGKKENIWSVTLPFPKQCNNEESSCQSTSTPAGSSNSIKSQVDEFTAQHFRTPDLVELITLLFRSRGEHNHHPARLSRVELLVLIEETQRRYRDLENPSEPSLNEISNILASLGRQARPPSSPQSQNSAASPVPTPSQSSLNGSDDQRTRLQAELHELKRRLSLLDHELVPLESSLSDDVPETTST